MKSTIFRKILIIRPVEYLFRLLYWRFLAKFKVDNKKKTTKKTKIIEISHSEKNLHQGVDVFRNAYRNQRPILLHSSGRHFKALGIDLHNFSSIILSEMPNIGIVLPAIRQFPGRVDFRTRILSTSQERLFFDEETTPIWSGVALYSFLETAAHMKIPRRFSSYAINNTLLIGEPAIALSNAEKFEVNPLLPCGKQSVWYHLYLTDAQIIFWGVHPTKSMTMIHVAEEAWFNSWKHNNNWFKITEVEYPDGHIQPFFERKEAWSLRYSQEHLLYTLLRVGIMKKHKSLEGVVSCSARDLINFLNTHNKQGYPYVGKI